MRSKGTSIEPWGTPLLIFYGSEKWELIVTICDPSVKYKINQFKALPLIPWQWSLGIRMLWLIVSKAFLGSRKIAAVALPSFILFRMKSETWLRYWKVYKITKFFCSLVIQINIFYCIVLMWYLSQNLVQE